MKYEKAKLLQSMNHQGLRAVLYSTYVLVNIYAPFTNPT